MFPKPLENLVVAYFGPTAGRAISMACAASIYANRGRRGLGWAIAAFIIIGGSTAEGVAAPTATNRGPMSDVYLPAVIIPSDRKDLATLIRLYKSDPMSPYREIRFVTRQNYDGLLRRWERDHGHEAIASFNGRRLKELHAEYLGTGNHIVMAHGMVGMLRTLVNYGFTMLDSQECRNVKELLSGSKFKMGKPRKSSITAEQVVAICQQAHVLGFHSIALAQAAQFSFGWRQKDVIGEMVPLDEPVEGRLVIGNMKWARGWHWSELDANLILRHITSKKQKAVEIDVKLAPLVLRELKLLPDGQILKGGPVIICEATGLPYTNVRFRRTWRKIAKTVGVPDDVFQMDTRSGAISESFLLGADSSSVRKMATHAQQSQTDNYDRREAEAIANVMRLRAASHEQLMGDAA